eukprot:3152968-Ditylum_brightwellii.AAC.1
MCIRDRLEAADVVDEKDVDDTVKPHVATIDNASIGMLTFSCNMVQELCKQNSVTKWSGYQLHGCHNSSMQYGKFNKASCLDDGFWQEEEGGDETSNIFASQDAIL